MKLFWEENQLLAVPHSLVLQLRHNPSEWVATSIGRSRTWTATDPVDKVKREALIWFEELVGELHAELMRIVFDGTVSNTTG